MEGSLKITQTEHSIKVKLNNGNEMPMIGFGTWKLDNDKCPDVIYNAIKMGYRHIDCASVYFNEADVAKGIQRALKQKIVQRKDLFITSKLWNTYHRPENVQKAIKRSLQDFGIQYFDLYLMHYPITIKYVPIEQSYPSNWYADPNVQVLQEDTVPVADTWRAMEELVKTGLIKSIGASNFNVALLRDLFNSSRIMPAVVQNEIHPYMTQKKLIRFCHQKGVHVTSYSTLGGSSYVEMKWSEEKDKIVNNQDLQKIAKRLGKSVTQVVLRWAIQCGLSVIPKSTNPDHMEENKRLLGWKLEEDDVKCIDGLNRNQRFCDPGVFAEKAMNHFYPLYE